MEEEKFEDRLKIGFVESDRKEVIGIFVDDFIGFVEICIDFDSNGI